MRVPPVVGLSLLLAATGIMTASAETAKRKGPPAAPGPSLLSEFRFGFSAHDPWGPERGSGNVAGELLFAKPFTSADLFTSYFIPRPHVGGSLNFDSRTSYGFAGLTWSVDLTPRVFVEGSLGGAIHNREGHPHLAPPGRQALGCSPLFREAGSVGVRLSTQWSLIATVEHLSDWGTCGADRRLTNVGARVGYAF
ncbi:MAG TPA: acyloxyacyl hydrolase [Microvirga sp.]|nr:acyloxyacyl hydrolase [Microvirga sp.]